MAEMAWIAEVDVIPYVEKKRNPNSKIDEITSREIVTLQQS